MIRLGLRLCFALALVQATLSCQRSYATLETILDNGPSDNRVDIVFLGDGYTQANLDAGTYRTHVSNYLDYMFAGGVLADPFPRYEKFFNAHAVELVSNEAGADIPSQSIYVDTALDATYDSFDIERLLTISDSKANAERTRALRRTGITADMQFVTVNSSKYGGAGGSWATFAGANSSAREIALHEIGHSFSDLADEYDYGGNGTNYTGGEPSEVNITKSSTGAKWSQWDGFDDPRGSTYDIGAYEGGGYYETGLYRPSVNSKMRSLGRAFDAVSREQLILDIYDFVDPLDDWLDTSLTIEDASLWVDVIDPEVIEVDWSVDGRLVPSAEGEVFDAASYGYGPGVYSVVARAYDSVLDYVETGDLLDLVRRDFESLQQELTWTLVINPQELPSDFDEDGHVDGDDLLLWELGYGETQGAEKSDGDANEDGKVDGSDFLIWQHDFAPQAPSRLVAAPEPASWMLLMGLAAGLLARRR